MPLGSVLLRLLFSETWVEYNEITYKNISINTVRLECRVFEEDFAGKKRSGLEVAFYRKVIVVGRNSDIANPHVKMLVTTSWIAKFRNVREHLLI